MTLNIVKAAFIITLLAVALIGATSASANTLSVASQTGFAPGPGLDAGCNSRNPASNCDSKNAMTPGQRKQFCQDHLEKCLPPGLDSLFDQIMALPGGPDCRQFTDGVKCLAPGLDTQLDQFGDKDLRCGGGVETCSASHNPPPPRPGSGNGSDGPGDPSFTLNPSNVAAANDSRLFLAGTTMIDTPGGPVPIQDLTVGSLVWTSDNAGTRTLGIVLKAVSHAAPAGAFLDHVVLRDGRNLLAPAAQLTVVDSHQILSDVSLASIDGSFVTRAIPLSADGRKIGDLPVGYLLDGSPIITFETVPYSNQMTYEIVPSGTTGEYWANGILLKSELAPN